MLRRHVLAGIVPSLVAMALLVAAAPAPAAAAEPISELSPTLAEYLADHSGTTGVVVRDLSRGVTYAFNADRSTVMASSVKVLIMFAVMRRAEAHDRALTDWERSELAPMIEYSSNTAASALWNYIGGSGPLVQMMEALDISGYVPDYGSPTSWGYGTITPRAMSALLARFWEGRVLSSSTDYSYARYLLSHVTASQRWGVGDTAPAGSRTWQKNGWVVGPDGHWAVNSSGIVKTASGRVYVVSVYSSKLGTESAGISIANHVCALVAAALG